MSIYKTATSPYYRYDFQIEGNRFHGSTKARNKREAEAVERRLKEDAVKEVRNLKATGKAPLTIDVAIGRFWIEKGQYRSMNRGFHGTLEWLVNYFGKDKRLDEIDDQAIVDLVVFKRQQPRWGKIQLKRGKVRTVSNTTVNRVIIEPLKSIFRRAKLWGYRFSNEPNWTQHKLKEPQERVRELAAHEQQALINAMRDDYLLWFEFLQLTARRLNETLIMWSDVDWSTNEILTIGKGDRRVWTPMSASIRAILESCKGHHPIYVFTYTAQRTRDGRIKGQRYPITHGGASTIWKRVVCKAGVQDFRLHDNRHDTASKVLRKTGNLKVVSRLLNHTNIATTSKYAHVLDEEVAEALERNAESRSKSRINGTLPPASPA